MENKERQPGFLYLKFLKRHVKPPSRDFIVISCFRWPVPGEVITWNRLTSDTDPCSYRCLKACWRYRWLVAVWAFFQLCEPDYWCLKKMGYIDSSPEKKKFWSEDRQCYKPHNMPHYWTRLIKQPGSRKRKHWYNLDVNIRHQPQRLMKYLKDPL